MLDVLKIATVNNGGITILREKAVEVEYFNDTTLQTLIDNMILTGNHYRGVGIAAPQVYKNPKIFIMFPHSGARKISPTAMINPSILTKSRNMVLDREGCLSIPGFFGEVKRHKYLRVKYYTRIGKCIISRIDGLTARIFQHELDHLNGQLYTDIAEQGSVVTD